MKTHLVITCVPTILSTITAYILKLMCTIKGFFCVFKNTIKNNVTNNNRPRSALYTLAYNVQPIVKPLRNQHSSRLQTMVKLLLIFEKTTNNHGIMQILIRISFKKTKTFYSFSSIQENTRRYEKKLIILYTYFI